MNTYTFADQHIIVAYRDMQFVGVLVTVPGESLSLKELLEYFGTMDPTYFVAEKIPSFTQEITSENFREMLADHINRYTTGDTSVLDNPALLYIPRTIH